MVAAASRHHGLPATRLGSGRRGAREDDAAAETRPNQSLQLKKPELSPSTSRVPQSTVAPGRVRDPWRRAASSAAAAPARLLLLAHREARSRRHMFQRRAPSTTRLGELQKHSSMWRQEMPHAGHGHAVQHFSADHSQSLNSSIFGCPACSCLISFHLRKTPGEEVITAPIGEPMVCFIMDVSFPEESFLAAVGGCPRGMRYRL